MNSFTRPLSHHRPWICLPLSTTRDSLVALNPAHRQSYSLCQQNCSTQISSSGGILKLHGLMFTPSRDFQTSSGTCAEHNVKTNRDVVSKAVQNSFLLLGVEQDCTDQELKNAYLEKAKAYHPDSGATSADPYKFSQVKDAYKNVLEYRKGHELQEEELNEEIIFDIKHTAPQHRQYLEFEGVGFGTPSQRQRQYQQHRVARVTENIFQHRIQKLASETEDALVVKDKQQAKKTVISNALDRIVEDLIQESMKRGDFNNLPGQGQPLSYSAHNPFVDVTTHNLNKIMVNNGFAPEWIMLQSEIRTEIQHARQALALVYNRLEKPCSAKDAKEWRTAQDKFQNQVDEINLKIKKFNLIVPLLNKQKMPFVAERETKKILANVKEYLPENKDAYMFWDISVPQMPSASSVAEQTIDWKQVWHDIKSVFKSSQHK